MFQTDEISMQFLPVPFALARHFLLQFENAHPQNLPVSGTLAKIGIHFQAFRFRTKATPSLCGLPLWFFRMFPQILILGFLFG